MSNVYKYNEFGDVALIGATHERELNTGERGLMAGIGDVIDLHPDADGVMLCSISGGFNWNYSFFIAYDANGQLVNPKLDYKGSQEVMVLPVCNSCVSYFTADAVQELSHADVEANYIARFIS